MEGDMQAGTGKEVMAPQGQQDPKAGVPKSATFSPGSVLGSCVSSGAQRQILLPLCPVSSGWGQSHIWKGQGEGDTGEAAGQRDNT